MSSLIFFPTRWFTDASWKSIQVIGRIPDGKSLFLRIGFEPFFTVKYSENTSPEQISEYNDYLLGETPIVKAIPGENPQIVRYFLNSKEEYMNGLTFFKRNVPSGELTDEHQSITSKFFSFLGLVPGKWQRASNLQTLRHSGLGNYSVADLEYFTNTIETVEVNIPQPKDSVAFFDLETIPSDNVSFPDATAEEPPDSIFAASLILSLPVRENPVQVQKLNLLFLVTSLNFPQNYMTNPERTGVPYETTVVPVTTEKQLLESFFGALARFRPDYLVSMNGRLFDIHYLGARAQSLGVEIPPFTKILNYSPTFYTTDIVMKEPFPLINRVYAIQTPGMAQIDILDIYRRMFPELGNHKLETISQIVLGRGKTGLGIQEMFEKYRSGSIEDLKVVIDYSIQDSVLLQDLWEASSLRELLNIWANFWREDAQVTTTTDMTFLFSNLYKALIPGSGEPKYQVGRPFTTERKQGVHRNVYFYQLSELYLKFLRNLGGIATDVANYFAESGYGVIPFESGYFPTYFGDVQTYLSEITLRSEGPIWIEKNSIATVEPLEIGYPPKDILPLVVVLDKSWIVVTERNQIFKKGLNDLVRPSFPLLERYVNQAIQDLLENQPVTFSDEDVTLDDYALTTKVSQLDLVNKPARKQQILEQIQELGLPIGRIWTKYKYIKTTQGDVISQIYSRNPEKYFSMINVKFYRDKINKVKRIFS